MHTMKDKKFNAKKHKPIKVWMYGNILIHEVPQLYQLHILAYDCNILVNDYNFPNSLRANWKNGHDHGMSNHMSHIPSLMQSSYHISPDEPYCGHVFGKLCWFKHNCDHVN